MGSWQNPALQGRTDRSLLRLRCRAAGLLESAIIPPPETAASGPIADHGTIGQLPKVPCGLGFFKLMLLVGSPIWIWLLSLVVGSVRDVVVRFATLSVWKTVRSPSDPPAELAPAADILRRRPTPWKKAGWEALLAAGDDLCDAYQATDDATRRMIRNAFAGHQRVLLRYYRLSARKLRQRLPPAEAELVFRRGATALLIDDLQDAWRDTVGALNGLHAAARKSGIDAPRIAAEVAGLQPEDEAAAGFQRSLRVRALLLRLGQS
jgi:hypothetical protein